jgi:hypothetical protein
MNIFFNDTIKIYRLLQYKTKKSEISENDLKLYENYETVKHWFESAKNLDNKFLFVATHNNIIVGYYFKCIEKGNRVEIIPEYRKNGIFSKFNVYDKLLNKILSYFPFGLYSTVSVFNIPSLSTHFKHNFKINDIVSFDLCQNIEIYYEYKDKSYLFNSSSNFEDITNMFIYDNRNIKCYIIDSGKKIELNKKNNCFYIEEQKYENLNKVKYKFILNKDDDNFIDKLKKNLKFFDKKNLNQIDEIGKKYNFEFIGWLLENGYINMDKGISDFKLSYGDKIKSVEMIWDKYVYKKFYGEYSNEELIKKYTEINKKINNKVYKTEVEKVEEKISENSDNKNDIQNNSITDIEKTDVIEKTEIELNNNEQVKEENLLILDTVEHSYDSENKLPCVTDGEEEIIELSTKKCDCCNDINKLKHEDITNNFTSYN